MCHTSGIKLEKTPPKLEFILLRGCSRQGGIAMFRQVEKAETCSLEWEIA